MQVTTSYQNYNKDTSTEYILKNNYMSSHALTGFENTEPGYIPQTDYKNEPNSSTNMNNIRKDHCSALGDTFMSGTNGASMLTDYLLKAKS